MTDFTMFLLFFLIIQVLDVAIHYCREGTTENFVVIIMHFMVIELTVPGVCGFHMTLVQFPFFSRHYFSKVQAIGMVVVHLSVYLLRMYSG